MAVDERLAKKGRGENRAGLVQQGGASLERAKQYAVELAEHGWDADDTQKLEAALAAVNSKAAEKADAAGGSHGDTVAEHNAITEAKALVRRLRNVLRGVLRDNPNAGVTEADFHAGDRLARSVPKISAYLNDVKGKVAKLDEPLKKFFKQKLVSQLFADAKAKLDKADAKQEVSLTSLPLETQQVYEAKGRLLELIEKLNGVGKNAFDGDANLVGLFNKDLMLRARKSGGGGDANVQVGVDGNVPVKA